MARSHRRIQRPDRHSAHHRPRIGVVRRRPGPVHLAPGGGRHHLGRPLGEQACRGGAPRHPGQRAPHGGARLQHRRPEGLGVHCRRRGRRPGGSAVCASDRLRIAADLRLRSSDQRRAVDARRRAGNDPRSRPGHSGDQFRFGDPRGCLVAVLDAGDRGDLRGRGGAGPSGACPEPASSGRPVPHAAAGIPDSLRPHPARRPATAPPSSRPSMWPRASVSSRSSTVSR